MTEGNGNDVKKRADTGKPSPKGDKMIREPSVAGRFYPGSSDSLLKNVTDLLTPYSSQEKRKALAVISPHAGYVYSGDLAAEVLSSVVIPETVIILGLNHHGRGKRAAVSDADSWNMVLADIDIDQTFCELLAQPGAIFERDDIAHQYEHSVEVQIPFLFALQPKLKIVPIVLSHLSYEDCRKAADDLINAIQRYARDVLIVSSTDMSHYESRQSASQKDALALDRIVALDPEGLYNVVHQHRISMCGVVPTTVSLLAAKKLGASSGELIRYTDSGEVSGDTEQVVGYGGLVIS